MKKDVCVCVCVCACVRVCVYAPARDRACVSFWSVLAMHDTMTWIAVAYLSMVVEIACWGHC